MSNKSAKERSPRLHYECRDMFRTRHDLICWSFAELQLRNCELR